MKNLKNNKGFTLVELLAVIVVLAIVMGLAVVGITSVLDNTRKSAFASDARSYLQGAHSLVQADEASVLLGGTATYAPSCAGASGSKDTKTFSIDKIPLDNGGKSPYGNEYVDTGDTGSMIKVETEVQSDGSCKYTYSIFLTDGSYQVGSTTGSGTSRNITYVTEADINASQVKIKTS